MDQGHHLYFRQHQPQHLHEEKERLPQWSQAETTEFLAIRAELDRSFMETKRNKLLWDLISTRMRERGFVRTPEQCKCKWKNLVTRFKGNETMEGETSSTSKQFTFQEEMRGIFSNRMERLLSFDEDKDQQLWSEEEDEQQEQQQQQEVEEGSKKKRRTTSGLRSSSGNTSARFRSREKAVTNIEEVKKAMKDFMDWQMQMEAQWMEAAEAREAERRAAVEDWRRMMVALAEQRAEMHRRWREREEERRLREEERAERRHQLFVAVLTKLTDQNM